MSIIDQMISTSLRRTEEQKAERHGLTNFEIAKINYEELSEYNDRMSQIIYAQGLRNAFVPIKRKEGSEE